MVGVDLSLWLKSNYEKRRTLWVLHWNYSLSYQKRGIYCIHIVTSVTYTSTLKQFASSPKFVASRQIVSYLSNERVQRNCVIMSWRNIWNELRVIIMIVIISRDIESIFVAILFQVCHLNLSFVYYTQHCSCAFLGAQGPTDNHHNWWSLINFSCSHHSKRFFRFVSHFKPLFCLLGPVQMSNVTWAEYSTKII